MFYHLSFDVLESIGEFVPRIPGNRMASEDNSSLRICCSDSLSGALLAMPDNADVLNSNKLFPLIKVYELDESKIDADNILYPEQIIDKVPDALRTREHWITTIVKPTKSYIIQIVSMNYDRYSNDITDFRYDILTKEVETDCSDFYSYDIKIEASEETLNILGDIIYEDIEDVDDLLIKATNLIEDTLSFISNELSQYSTEINNGVMFHIEGYFVGESRDESFIFHERAVIDEIYRVLDELIGQYCLSIEIS